LQLADKNLIKSITAQKQSLCKHYKINKTGNNIQQTVIGLPKQYLDLLFETSLFVLLK